MFSDFADVYDTLLTFQSVNEITGFINRTHKEGRVDVDELHLWLYLLLTFEQKCKINDKHLLTVFCKIRKPHIDRKNLQEAFRTQGVADTCSRILNLEANTPTLTMVEAYNFLQSLQELPTKSSTLSDHFCTVLAKCDVRSLKCLVNLVRNTGKNRKLLAKKRNLYLFKQVFGKRSLDEMNEMLERLCRDDAPTGFKRCVPGNPIEPMLARPCKSLEGVDFKKMCVELKYDGERVQIHKFNDEITCYKRNLNVNYRCQELAPEIKAALAVADNAILDCELTGSCPVTYCIIAFDIIYLDGQCLMNTPLNKRKAILAELLGERSLRIVPIEYVVSDSRDDVTAWIKSCLREKLVEGVVIKCWDGPYEPKRKKWLKIKREYFENVCSADLVVVGGWKPVHGRDKRIIIYLVATPFYDHDIGRWMFLPVSKVKLAKHNLEEMMVPYEREACPWLVVNDYLYGLNKVPNLVARDPAQMPVWEMEGDFIRSKDGLWECGRTVSQYVSIRLPRFIRVRDDKTYLEATRLLELKLLCEITGDGDPGGREELCSWYLRDNLKTDALCV